MEKGGQGVNESNFALVEYINKNGAAGGCNKTLHHLWPVIPPMKNGSNRRLVNGLDAF